MFCQERWKKCELLKNVSDSRDDGSRLVCEIDSILLSSIPASYSYSVHLDYCKFLRLNGSLTWSGQVVTLRMGHCVCVCFFFSVKTEFALMLIDGPNHFNCTGFGRKVLALLIRTPSCDYLVHKRSQGWSSSGILRHGVLTARRLASAVSSHERAEW